MQETVKKGRQKDSTMLHFEALFCVETSDFTDIYSMILK